MKKTFIFLSISTSIGDIELASSSLRDIKLSNPAGLSPSWSRTIIELEGNLVNEVLKKGCPLDISSFKAGDCANSVYNGITVTLDFISDNPKKVRICGLRSFGESLYHSVTDSCLEFGYKAL